MRSKFVLIILAGILVLACIPVTINIGQQPSWPTPVMDVPTSTLPDLAITSSIISMVDINGNCLSSYELTAILVNQGSAPAPDVVVEELMSGHLFYAGILEVGQSMVLQFPSSPNGMYRLMIDPQNLIAERDETNNIVTPSSTLATPPGYCLPGMIITPTPTPHPFITPPPTQVNYFPMFTAPASWTAHTQPYVGYQFQFPAEAQLDQYSERVVISLPFLDGTQMIEKSIWIETRPANQEECFALIPWDGVTIVNGLEMYFSGGTHWENAMGGLSYVPGEYAAYRNGICYRLSLKMGLRNDAAATGAVPLPTPNRADMDFGILLNIISTFRVQ